MRDALGAPQTLLVLGGSSDIGLAIARALVGDRVRTVVLAGRRQETLEAAAERLREEGAQAHTKPFDALDTASHPAAIGSAFERCGDVDVALVAFGVLDGTPEELMAVNGTGAVSALAELARRMRAQGHGTIVLLSSVAAVRPRPANFAYGASKTASDAFARGLRSDLHGSGVNVLVVRPGSVRTKMTAGRGAAPLQIDAEDVAHAVIEGLRRNSHIVYAPRAMRLLAAVLTLLPEPLLRRLPEK